MDFLTQQEISGIKQDMQHGLAKQEVEKMEYEKKLRETMGQEMKDLLEHPEKFEKYVVYAKKVQKKKKRGRLKENLKKLLGLSNENQQYL